MMPQTQKCPECDVVILHCGGNSPFYYCKKCNIHYHINLFISNNEWREMLGLPPEEVIKEKKKKGLEKWLK